MEISQEVPMDAQLPLADIRNKLSLTQRELGHAAGIPQSTIADYEAGTCQMPFSSLSKLRDALDARGDTETADQLSQAWFLAEATLSARAGGRAICPGRFELYQRSDRQDLEEAVDPVTRHHFVDRRPGQHFCPTHGHLLLIECPLCDYPLHSVSEKDKYCAGCGHPFAQIPWRIANDPEARRKYDELILLQKERSGIEEIEGSPEGTILDHAQHGAPPPIPVRAKLHNRHVSKQTVDCLTPRERVHYEVATQLRDRLGETPFSRKLFIAAYLELSPDSPKTTVLPGDFCVDAGGDASTFPWFLIKKTRGEYLFIGLDGLGDSGQEEEK